VGQYAQNAGAVFSLKYHLVWCPNYRRPVLVGAVDRRLQALLQQKTKELNIHIHALEILPDHVHLFVESDPTRCVAEIVNRRKGFTSHTLRAEFGFAALAIAHSLESQLLCRYGRLRQRNSRP
jgi:putative transposase